MSDLQLALIILGAFIIGGVVVYNWLQEKKLRKEVTSDFIVPQKDVLAEDFHIDTDAYLIDKELAEVTQKSKHFEQKTIPDDLHSEEAVQIDEPSPEPHTQNPQAQNYVEAQILASRDDKPAYTEPTITEPIIKASLHEKIQAAQVNLPETAHPQIDLTAVLYGSKNMLSQDLTSLKEVLAHITLPSTLHGMDEQGKWVALDDSNVEGFKQVACSLQLADRGGPVAKNVLNKFQFAVEDAGLSVNAHVEWQGSGDAMQRALDLDQFCIEVDQMISAHIAEGDIPIHGTKFKGLAEANGMQLKEDGKYYFYANDQVLFTAIDSNNIPFTTESLRSNVLKSITMQIEIPKVSSSEQVFNQMIGMAQKMASSLGAILVDDNQKPLGDLQLEKIRQQLRVIHATMVARGIMPGSPSSMRLFN